MSSRQSARIVADAIRSAHRRETERRGRSNVRATVTSVTPLELDLHGVDLALDADDVSLAKVVASATLARGDVLVLNEVDEGDWIAVGIE